MNKKRLQKGLKILETELVFNYKDSKTFFDKIKEDLLKTQSRSSQRKERKEKIIKE